MNRENVIIVVSGLPRSGTSLMMKMLEAGGLSPLTDMVREADSDNPKGYYEFERVKKLPQDTDWLPEARGKAVKVLAELIKHLPDGFEYRIVFMMRNIDEIVASQRRMMINRGEDPDSISDDEMGQLLRSYLKNLKVFIKGRENMETCYISYNDLMNDPDLPLEEIDEFFEGSLDVAKMRMVIDSRLYRNRK